MAKTAIPCADIYGWTTTAREAANAYERQLVEYIRSKCLPPNSLELRQKHAELKFEAVDHFRKNSVGESIGVWKLEREIAEIYTQTLETSRVVRKQSLTDMERPCAPALNCSCSAPSSRPSSP